MGRLRNPDFSAHHRNANFLKNRTWFRKVLRRTGLNITMLFLFLFPFHFFGNPQYSFSQPESENSVARPISIDASFHQKKQEILDSYEYKKKDLREKIEKLEMENSKMSEKVNNLAHQSDKYELWILSIFKLGGSMVNYLLWFLPLMVLNHFLYLFFFEKAFFLRFHKVVWVIFIALELIMVVPFIAAAQHDSAGQDDSMKSQLEPLEKKISKTNDFLKKSPVEKAILALESISKNWVELPRIDVGDSDLTPLSGRIHDGTFEYYFTMAALYLKLGKKERCSDMLQAANAVPLSSSSLNNPYLTRYYKEMLQYFLENKKIVQASSASKMIIKMYVARNDVAGLIEFSSYLSQVNLKDSEDVALKSLTDAVATMDQYLSILNHLISVQRISDASANMESAIERCHLLDQIETLINFCLKHGWIDQYRKAKEKAVGLCRDTSDFIKLSKFLVSKERQEDGVLILNLAKEKSRIPEELILIAKVAHELQFNSIAIESIERIFLSTPNAADFTIAPKSGKNGENVPINGLNISIATYLGSMHQQNKNFKNAELAYKIAVESDIDSFLEKDGFVKSFTGNANNFYYLRQFWLEREPEKAGLLDEIYSDLLEGALVSLEGKEQRVYSDLQSRYDHLKKGNQNLLQEISVKKNKKNDLFFKLFLIVLYLISLFVFFGLLLTGWTIKGLQASSKATGHKFYAFFCKFSESAGWSTIFSVIGALGGTIMVLFSQFFGIIHKIEEDSLANGEMSKDLT